jgi:transposase
VDAILYVVRTGCSWRQLPADFPPWETVDGQFKRWEQRRVTERILDLLREQVRLAEGRDPQPTAGIIDSQSVKGADAVGADSRGYDAGKRINGRNRFIVTDTSACWLPRGCCPPAGRTATAPKAHWSPPPWRCRRCGTSSPIKVSPAGWSTGPGWTFASGTGHAAGVRLVLGSGGAGVGNPGPQRREASLGNLAGLRQWIESINDTLKGQLNLERHGGRTPAGVYARVGQRLLALAAAIWHHWRLNAEDKRSLIAYDH